MDRATIAVVEDDPEYREQVLIPVLAGAGFEAVGLGSALEFYREMLARRFALVLLDVELPDDDGYSIAAHLRGLSQSIGIVMLTGRGSAPDRMRGLDAGADAYLAKPVDMQELVATLRNLANRIPAGRVATAEGHERQGAPAGSHWRLDEQGWRVRSPCGGEVLLSLPERQVMMLLDRTPGVPVPREALIARLAGNQEEFDPRRLEMLVYRLRRKCRGELGRELPLKSVRGVGYVLAW